MSGPTPTSTGVTYSSTSYTNIEGSVKTAKKELDAFATMESMDELDMIKYNMAASRYSTMVSLGSGLVKNLSDTEKQVANKM